MADTSQVLSEIISGDALGLSAAARLLPAHRGEGRANPSTIWRWIRQGTRTCHGQTVQLEAARVGGKWLTSKAALMRFMAASTPTAPPEDTPQMPQIRSERQQQRASIAAVEKLDRFLGGTGGER